MTVLNDVRTYLIASSTLFTATNLFMGILPETTFAATALYPTGGVFPLHYFSTSGQTRGYERPGLQALSRSTSFATAEAHSYAVYTILDGVANRNLPTTSGTAYVSIDAVQQPFLVHRDENERFVMGVNFNVVKSTG